MPATFATARYLWEDGAARIRSAPPADRRDLERAVDATVLELRRRIGRNFRIDELVDLYNEGTDWVGTIAVRVAPENPNAWDAEAVSGAAFWRHAREAVDFAGGRRLDEPS